MLLAAVLAWAVSGPAMARLAPSGAAECSDSARAGATPAPGRSTTSARDAGSGMATGRIPQTRAFTSARDSASGLATGRRPPARTITSPRDSASGLPTAR